MKCLIVEDDFNARKLLQIYLSDYADCFIAVNGREAVEAVRQALDEAQPYDLICLDMMMPEMNGCEATKTLRDKGIKTPIVALTAYAMKGDDTKCIEAGCDDYISKPIDREQLLRIVRKYLPSKTQDPAENIDSIKTQVDELSQLSSGKKRKKAGPKR